MLIEKLELENFGPYYGSHTLELPTEGPPLIVIHGENMSGKTSFLNAIRWCFYGEARDRNGSPMPVVELVNSDAYSEGKTFVSVKMTVISGRGSDAERFVLRRQRQASPGFSTPEVDDEFEEIVEIDIDGVVQTSGMFSQVVEQLIPKTISRFFLFDGELLNEYEALVKEGGSVEAEAVKASIESILGVPAATQGRDDMERLAGDVASKLKREGSKHGKAKSASEELEKLTEQQKLVSKDLQDLDDALKKARRDQQDLDQKLQDHAEAREDAGRKEELEAQIVQLVKDRDRLLGERREKAGEVWRDILAPRLKVEIEQLESEFQSLQTVGFELNEARGRREELELSLENSVCSQCGQDLPEATLAPTRERLDDLATNIADLEQAYDDARSQELQGVISKLREFAPAGVVGEIGAQEENLKRNAVDTYKAEQKLKDILIRLGNIDSDAIRSWELESTKLRKHIEQTIHEKHDRVEEQKEIESQVQKCKKVILSSEGTVFQKLKAETELVDSLRRLFDLSVDHLTQDLKDGVESAATDIFKRLTTDKSYSGLKVNDNYGLGIVDADGDDVIVRSAGAEQIVALSLLGALNRMASKKAPVVMDTPFGRLDKNHRRNILEYLPSMADQVVLLVHGGEVDAEKDLQHVADQVAKEFVIVHDKSTQSRIEEAKVVLQ